MATTATNTKVTGLPERLLVQVASYNTNLQGVDGTPQDLVDWLAPTLQVSSFLAHERRAPDIVAVGFQELLPLHLGLSGFSKAVIDNRDTLIKSQIEAHAINKESYSLIAKIVNGGVALLVYGRDDTVARYVTDVQTSWTGCGPGYMGNKGAVGVRFRMPGPEEEGVGETYTFVCAHLTAHAPKLANRIADFHHIVGSLLFPPILPGEKGPSTMYSSSHLFFFGDLNFRVVVPPDHPLAAFHKQPHFAELMESSKTREELKEFDQLINEQKKGTIFTGFHEGEFWTFKCSYKYKLGEVDKYSAKRAPSWTDRVLYATHSDSPDTPLTSNITNVLYTSIPGYTTSDHKPVVSLLLMPPRLTSQAASTTLPVIQLPADYSPTPDRRANLKRYFGRSLDRVIGMIWWLFVILGAGSSVLGIFNFFVGMGAWSWWKKGNNTLPLPVPGQA